MRSKHVEIPTLSFLHIKQGCLWLWVTCFWVQLWGKGASPRHAELFPKSGNTHGMLQLEVDPATAAICGFLHGLHDHINSYSYSAISRMQRTTTKG